MSEEVIGSGRVEIEVDDKSALSALRKIESEFERTMDRIDREEASLTVDADTTKFDNSLKEVDRKLAGIERKKSVAELRLETAQFEDELKRQKLALKKLEGEHAEVVIQEDKQAAKKFAAAIKKKRLEVKRFDGLVAEAKLELKFNEAEFKAAEARLKAIEERTRALEAATEKVHREQERRARKEAQWNEKVRKTQETLWRQRTREFTQDERQAYRMEAVRRREEQQRERDLASLPKLRSQYASLADTIERLNETRRKVKRDPDAAIRVDLKIADAENDMKMLKRRLKALGEDPPVIVNVHPGFEFGSNLRRTLRDGAHDRGVRGAAQNAGVLIGRELSAGIVNGIKNNLSPRALARTTGGIMATIGHKLSGLSEMTVRVGPFTATLRQLVTALAVLGPVLVDLIGAFGSLISVMASATLGVAALTAGFAGGAIPAMLGMGLVVKDVAQEFKAAKAATKAYNDAVMKNGKDSPKAAAKLEELKNVMGAVSDETAKQFAEGQKLGKMWDKLTKQAHASVWTAIGNAMESAGKMMPMFAKNTNESMGVAEKATSKWMKALSDPQGRKVLNTMMDNFRRSLGPILDGLGSIVGYLGKVGAEASKYIPQMARQFRDWAAGINATADGSQEFRDKIANLVESTKNLGAFMMSFGRLMKAFFGGGVDAGQGFLVTMTETMDRWTAFLNTTRGQNNLRKFFRESVEGAKAFFAVLVPIVKSFAEWAMQLAPTVRLLMDVFGALSYGIGKLLEITALRSSMSALVATLAILWGVGKIKAATTAISGFTNALFRMGKAQKAVAAGNVATSATGTAAAATGAGAAASRGAGAAAGATAGAVGATVGRRLLGGLTGLLKKAGPVGIAIGLSDAIFKSLDIIGQKQTFAGKVNALSDNIIHTFTFGLYKSADQRTAEAFTKVREAILRNADAKIPKDILNDVLTKQQVNLIPTLRAASAAAASFIRENKLPPFKAHVELGGEAAFKAGLDRITANFGLMESHSFGSLREIKASSAETFDAIKRTMGTDSAAGRAAVERNFQLTAAAIVARMREGKTSTSAGWSAIRSAFVTNANASRKTTEANFQASLAAIRSTMGSSKKSVESGLSAIHKLFITYLKKLGFTAPKAIALAAEEHDSPGSTGAGTLQKTMPKARGGFSTVGSPNAKGRDSVPAMLNGQPSIVANGENVAVFNRHQRKALDQRLADQGGLQGFFQKNNRPHYMSRGGFAGGGVVGDTDYSPAMANAMNQLADAYGHTISVQSGGRTMAEQAALVRQKGLYSASNPTGAAAPSANAPHIRGIAADITPGREALAGLAGRFGLSFPLPAEPWHIQLGGAAAAGAGMSGGGAPIAAPQIKRIMVAAGMGAAGAVAQSVLDIVRRAAQSKLDAAAATTGGGPGGSAAPPGQIREWLAAGLSLAGQSPSAANINTLYGRVMQESGGNPGAVNNWDSNARAGHPSKGLLQTIDSTFRQYMVPGHGNIFNPVDNVAAAVRYMLARYGHLVGRGGGGYARGGLLAAAGGALIGEGAAPEWRVDALTGKGYKTNGPEITKLKASEAIIPTEKRHRARGAQIFGKIADDLGLGKFAGGVQNTVGTNRATAPNAGKVLPNYSGSAYRGATNAAGFYQPSSNLGNAPAIPARPKSVSSAGRGSNFKKRKNNAYKSGRGYVRYIAGLKVAQEDWEHEVSVRQAQVREPESLIIEQGRIMVPNPETGKQEDLGPNMVINADGIAKYKDDLYNVQLAFNQLLLVIQTMIAAIPKALEAISIEEMFRKANISQLNKTITREKAIIASHQRGKQTKADQGIIDRHTKLLDKAEADKEHETTQLGIIAEDKKSLREDQRTQSWAYTDTKMEADKNWAEYNAVEGKATSEASAANASTMESAPTGGDGGGAGGAGSDQLTYGQQAALADTERANVLREFGGNAASLMAGGMMGTLMGGTGPGALNAAARDLTGASGSVNVAGAMNDSAGTGGGSYGALAGSQAASGAASSQQGNAYQGSNGASMASAGTKSVTINNHFLTPPPDTHTFIKGMEFESAGAF